MYLARNVDLYNSFAKILFSGFFESSKEQHLFEIEIFCKIINVVTVIFDQFNSSLLNKSIHLFKKNLTDPKRLNSSVCETVMPIMLTVERDEKELGRERREVKSGEVKMKGVSKTHYVSQHSTKLDYMMLSYSHCYMCEAVQL